MSGITERVSVGPASWWGDGGRMGVPSLVFCFVVPRLLFSLYVLFLFVFCTYFRFVRFVSRYICRGSPVPIKLLRRKVGDGFCGRFCESTEAFTLIGTKVGMAADCPLLAVFLFEISWRTFFSIFLFSYEARVFSIHHQHCILGCEVLWPCEVRLLALRVMSTPPVPSRLSLPRRPPLPTLSLPVANFI